MRFPLSQVGRHGHLHRQEQDAAAAGVAEEPGGAGRRESVPHRPCADSSRWRAERKPHPMINKRFPLVMMLEPLHACNLTCTGCGRIREYESSIRERLSLEQCLKAVDECGAPMVSICGGEPMLYPRDRRNWWRRFWSAANTFSSAPTACSSRRSLKEFKPRSGAWSSTSTWTAWKRITTWRWSAKASSAKPSKASRPPKQAGFKVFSNTTVYKETDMNEIWELFEFLEQFKVDGHQHFAGLRLFGRQRSRNFHDARGRLREVQGHRQDVQALPAGFRRPSTWNS